MLRNDTAVYYAMVFNPRTCDHDTWIGTASIEAILKAGLKPGLLIGYHPKELLPGGWGYRRCPSTTVG